MKRKAEVKAIHELARDLNEYFLARNNKRLNALAEKICNGVAFIKYYPPIYENHCLKRSGRTGVAYRKIKDIDTYKLLDATYKLKTAEQRIKRAEVRDALIELRKRVLELHYGLGFNESAGRAGAHKYVRVGGVILTV